MKQLFGVLLGITMFAGSMTAQAQPGKGKPGQGDQGAVIKELNLTPQQKEQMKKLNESFRVDMKKLMDNENITVKQQRDQRAAIIKKHRDEVEKILTPEQKKELETKRAEARARAAGMQARHLEMMKYKLNLTPEQVTAIRNNQEKSMNKMQSLLKNDAVSREAKKAQLEALKTENKNAMASILTKEQFQQWEEMRKQVPRAGKGRGRGPMHMRQGAPGRGGFGPGGPGNPPALES